MYIAYIVYKVYLLDVFLSSIWLRDGDLGGFILVPAALSLVVVVTAPPEAAVQ